MQLSAYLDRIGFQGHARPDRATLDAVQRLHMLAIPYENLDVQLGRPLTTSPAEAFEKLVTRRRGGWCYEMNGLMGWALAEIGFPVTRMEGAVMRPMLGDLALANHLVLRVDLPEGPVLADVGLGCGPMVPFAIAEGTFTAHGFDYAVETGDDGWWRLINHPDHRPPSFDFRLAPADEARLSSRCALLQSAPESIFVQNLICQRAIDGGFIALLGKVFSRITPGGMVQRTLASPDELLEVLARQFGLDEPAAAALWDRICERHAAVFA